MSNKEFIAIRTLRKKKNKSPYCQNNNIIRVSATNQKVVLNQHHTKHEKQANKQKTKKNTTLF